jgi:hypothetical protein
MARSQSVGLRLVWSLYSQEKDNDGSEYNEYCVCENVGAQQCVVFSSQRGKIYCKLPIQRVCLLAALWGRKSCQAAAVVAELARTIDLYTSVGRRQLSCNALDPCISVKMSIKHPVKVCTEGASPERKHHFRRSLGDGAIGATPARTKTPLIA